MLNKYWFVKAYLIGQRQRKNWRQGRGNWKAASVNTNRPLKQCEMLSI
jgi:hypothetical protein